MPTYEYKCTKCGDDFEVFQSMHDAPVTKCNKCGGEVKKVFGGSAGIIFKGSGFYVNDYKKHDAPPAACEGCAAAGGCAHAGDAS